MTNALQVAPIQWAELKDIDDIEPVNDADVACLAEVREVLKKHGKRDRFGVALLHKHFDMDADEMLVEYTDKVARELLIRTVKQRSAGNTIGTIWKLEDGESIAMLGCQQYCAQNVHQNHQSFHRQT